MAKKTRKEKIIASLRRELRKKQNKQRYKKGKSATKRQNKERAPIASYIKSDLRRTAILSILAIGFEVVLYFTLQ